MWKIKNIKFGGLTLLRKNFWTLLFTSIILIFAIGEVSINESGYQNLKTTYNFNDYVTKKIANLPDGITSLPDSVKANILTQYTNKIISQNLIGSVSKYIQNQNEENQIHKGIIYSIFEMFTRGEKQIQNIIKNLTTNNPFASLQYVIITIIISLIGLLIKILVANPLSIGARRIFLESINYTKTGLRSITFPFKNNNYLGTISSTFLKNLYLFLWSFTIVGGIIKNYSYLMVDYIVAENPKIDSKECIKMSREMMRGNKWHAFLLDFTFVFWNLLVILTFGIAGFFVTPYYQACFTELYRVLRADYIKNKKYNYELLNDNLLFKNTKDYPTYEIAKYGRRKRKIKIDFDELNVDYKLWDYFLLFFIFAFVGWIWEVGYFVFHYGVLINRGALYGPWLPIYGTGCTLVILLFSKVKIFKKAYNNPIKTFFYVLIICTVIEYLTSLYLELRTGQRYWNYTGIFLNINGRVCLESSLFFGIGGCLCIYLIGPWIKTKIDLIPSKVKITIASILTTFIIIDTIFTQIYPHSGDYITNDPSLQELKGSSVSE